jgi:hypothetical protein
MPDKPKLDQLAGALSKLEKEWQELANLLKGQPEPASQSVEVEKVLLRDASGIYRGKISVEENGAAGLFLSDSEGDAWAWLGVNQNGEAFLELKDHQREIRFKVPVGPPFTGTPEESAGGPAGGGNPGPAPEASEPTGDAAAYAATTEAAGAPEGKPLETTPPAAPAEGQPGEEGNSEVLQRLEKVERRQRGQKFAQVLILILLGAVLATQALVLTGLRVSGPLAASSLAVREPQVNLGEKLGLTGKAEPKRAEKAASPAASATGAAAPGVKPEASAPPEETEVLLVGSKTSNKYHYPTCKWAKTIRPERIITFKSVADAKAHGYIPCPVCKPPKN